MEQDTIEIKGVKYASEHSLRSYSCEGCDIAGIGCCIQASCMISERNDYTDVIYKQVKEKTK